MRGRPRVSRFQLGVALIAAASAQALAQIPPTESEVRAYTGLHAAAAAGNVAEIERLVAAGANRELRTPTAARRSTSPRTASNTTRRAC